MSIRESHVLSVSNTLKTNLKERYLDFPKDKIAPLAVSLTQVLTKH